MFESSPVTKRGEAFLRIALEARKQGTTVLLSLPLSPVRHGFGAG